MKPANEKPLEPSVHMAKCEDKNVKAFWLEVTEQQ